MATVTAPFLADLIDWRSKIPAQRWPLNPFVRATPYAARPRSPPRLYLFAETGEAANWVKNIRRNPNVTVRIGELHIDATARVLDRHIDRKLWDQVAEIANRKYGWGDGLPVEITPLSSGAPHSELSDPVLA